jgi:hypothetical protein
MFLKEMSSKGLLQLNTTTSLLHGGGDSNNSSSLVYTDAMQSQGMSSTSTCSADSTASIKSSSGDSNSSSLGKVRNSTNGQDLQDQLPPRKRIANSKYM